MPNKNFSKNLGQSGSTAPSGGRNVRDTAHDGELSADELLSGAQVPDEEDDDEDNAGLMQGAPAVNPAANRLQAAAQSLGIFESLDENPDLDDETGDASGHMERIGVPGGSGQSQSLTMPGMDLPDLQSDEEDDNRGEDGRHTDEGEDDSLKAVEPERPEENEPQAHVEPQVETEPKKRFSPGGFELDDEGLPVVPPEPTKKPGRASQEYIEKHEQWQKAKEERERMIEERKRSERLNSGLSPSHGAREVSGKGVQSMEENTVAQTVLDFVCNTTIQTLKDTYESEIYTKKYMEELFQGYLDGSVRSDNPLFKKLIAECLERADADPYLKENTKLVLQYIYEH